MTGRTAWGSPLECPARRGTVSPSADTIAPGDTLRLVAEAYDESGHMVAV